MRCDRKIGSRICLYLKSFLALIIFLLLITSIHSSHHIQAQPKNISCIIFNYDENTELIPIPVLDINTHKLIYVSIEPGRPLGIHLRLEPEIIHPKCKIQVNLTYNSISKYSATILGNGKVLMAILNNKMSRPESADDTLKVDWKIVIIDPKDCTSSILTVAKSSILLQVLPHESSFDVLLFDTDNDSDKGINKVVRYNDKGERLFHFAASIPDENFSNLIISKTNKLVHDYYYIASERKGNHSVVRRLNCTYGIRESYWLSHSRFLQYDENAYSVGYGQFSICYYDQNISKSLKCIFLQADLKNKISEISLSYNNEVERVAVTNLSEDIVLLVYIEKFRGRNFKVNSQFLYKNNGIGDPVELFKVHDVIHELYVFIIEEKHYCVLLTVDGQVMMKCF